MDREIVLDTETTGLDPKAGHRVIEIGCVEIINRLPTGKTFHKYLNPQRNVPEEATRVHGITEEFLKDKPLFKDVCDEFLDFVGDSKLIIHNAQFDIKFLNAELFHIKKPEIKNNQFFCTLIHARKKFPGAQNSLDALCRRFSIDNSHRTKHGALLDSEILAEVYLELMGGKQVAIGLENKEEKAEIVEKENNKVTNLAPKKAKMKKRNFDISEDEKNAHNEMLKNIENNLWQKYSNS